MEGARLKHWTDLMKVNRDLETQIEDKYKRKQVREIYKLMKKTRAIKEDKMLIFTNKMRN